MSIDKWHFSGGHKGRRAGGRFLCSQVWPATHADRFPFLNDSAREKAFSFNRPHANAARAMTPNRSPVFLHMLFDARNRGIELRAGRKCRANGSGRG